MEGIDQTQTHSPPPEAMDTSPPESMPQPLSHVVHSDYVPSELERDQIVVRIREMEANRQRIEREIMLASMALDLRRAEEQEQRNKINALKGSLSVMRRLPDELISTIVVSCVFFGRTSPWVLAQVAQRFRRITLQVRRIWSTIAIMPQKKNQPRYAYRDFRHECTDIEVLQHILQLSGKAPLEITVRHLNPDIARIIVKERDRWDALEYFGPADETSRNILFEPTDSRVLRKVVFGFSEWTPTPPVEWLEAAKPMSLDIRNGGLSGLARIKWWDRLEEFRIMAPWTSLVPTFGIGTMIGPVAENQLRDEFCNIMRKVCNRLKRLDIINISIPEDTLMQFPLLQELRFWNVGGWWQIDCRKLTKISFGLCPLKAPTKITYPNVREFEISLTSRGEMTTNIELPSLESFVLHDQSAEFIPPSLPITWNMIKKLRLCLHGLSSPLLLSRFRSMDALETLEIFDTPPSVHFFKKFEVGTKEPPICPALKRIFLELNNFKGKVIKDALLHVFEKVVSSRKANHALESLRVEWPQKIGGGETEFVQ